MVLDSFDFARSPVVDELATATFTQAELAAGFTDLNDRAIVDALKYLGLFLISTPQAGGKGNPRRFHYYDALVLALWATLIGTGLFPTSSRRKLAQQLAGLLFGDPVTKNEAKDRKAELAAEYEKAAQTPVGRAKFSGRLWKLHDARRKEILTDPYTASPFWWNRSYHVNFFLFACDRGELVTLCLDERKTSTLSMKWLESIGARSWCNVTEKCNLIDGQLMQILDQRAARSIEAE
jgi:hypothetical protein